MDDRFKVIIINMQKKYNLLSEIMNLTKDMAESISRNDDVSLQMLIAMRQEAMVKADECDQIVIKSMGMFDPDERKNIKLYVNASKSSEHNQNSEEAKIYEIAGKNKRILKKIIEIDQIINKKMGGKESFYK